MNNKTPYLSKTTYSLFKILHKRESMHDLRQIYLNHFKPAAFSGYTTVLSNTRYSSCQKNQAPEPHAHNLQDVPSYALQIDWCRFFQR